MPCQKGTTLRLDTGVQSNATLVWFVHAYQPSAHCCVVSFRLRLETRPRRIPTAIPKHRCLDRGAHLDWKEDSQQELRAVMNLISCPSLTWTIPIRLIQGTDVGSRVVAFWLLYSRFFHSLSFLYYIHFIFYLFLSLLYHLGVTICTRKVLLLTSLVIRGGTGSLKAIGYTNYS